MTAYIQDDVLVLDAESDFASLDFGIFPIIEGFELQLEDTDQFGCHLRMVTSAQKRIASFAWWDHADAYLREMSINDIPLGTPERPFYDAEQGWEIFIWESAGFVFVVQGDAEQPLRFYAWFRVPIDLYRSAWITVMEFARKECFAFRSMAAAIKSPLQVRTLLLGAQELIRVPEEIVGFTNLENLNLYCNRLIELPDEMAKLVRLKRLNLSFNMIERLPDTFAELRSLQWIDLTNNCLREIPRWFVTLPTLKEYIVGGNPISSETFSQFYAIRRGTNRK